MNQLYTVTVIDKSGRTTVTPHVRSENFSSPSFLVLEKDDLGRVAFNIDTIQSWISTPEKEAPNGT